jgi:hypothetical protein
MVSSTRPAEDTIRHARASSSIFPLGIVSACSKIPPVVLRFKEGAFRVSFLRAITYLKSRAFLNRRIMKPLMLFGLAAVLLAGCETKPVLKSIPFKD